MLASKSLKIAHNTFSLKGNAQVLGAWDFALQNAVDDAKQYQKLKFYSAIALVMFI